MLTQNNLQRQDNSAKAREETGERAAHTISRQSLILRTYLRNLLIWLEA